MMGQIGSVVAEVRGGLPFPCGRVAFRHTAKDTRGQPRLGLEDPFGSLPTARKGRLFSAAKPTVY